MMLTITHPAPEQWQVVDAGGEVQAIACTKHDPEGTAIPQLVTTWPTLEAAQAALEARLEWAYYAELKAWLRSLRICPTCATLMSFAKVERWAGRPPYDWKAARGECMGVPCTTCPWCVGWNRAAHPIPENSMAAPSCPHPISCEGLAAQHANTQPQPPCDHPRNPRKAAPATATATHARKEHHARATTRPAHA